MHAIILLLASLGQTVAEPGFEVPAQGHGKFKYQPAGSAWTFGPNGGLSGNGSGFTQGSVLQPERRQLLQQPR